MRILTWNCNLNLRKKYELIEAFSADLMIIQECEKLPADYFPNSSYFWTGVNENKGIGVIIRRGAARVSQLHDPNLIYFLPVETDDLRVLALWAFNHRAKRFGDDAVGKVPIAIDYYREWLGESEMGAIGGDFNNSAIWDNRRKDNNFSDINSQLSALSFESSYHLHSGDAYGSETASTYYQTKDQQKKFHIDYIYTKGLQLKGLEVGGYDDWIEHSDHVPLVTTYA